jgi:hypothetical protein
MLREPPYDDDGAGNSGDGYDGSEGAPAVTAVLRAALAPVTPQIDAAFIYGPMARGTARAHADVDVIVIGTAIYAEVIPHFIAASRRLGRTINPSVYGADEWRRKLAAGNSVMIALMKQPKVFVIGTSKAISQQS